VKASRDADTLVGDFVALAAAIVGGIVVGEGADASIAFGFPSFGLCPPFDEVTEGVNVVVVVDVVVVVVVVVVAEWPPQVASVVKVPANHFPPRSTSA